MNNEYIIDAHLHVGHTGLFFAPEESPKQLLAAMDKLNVRAAVCCDMVSVHSVALVEDMERHRGVFEESDGRIHYLGAFNPCRWEDCMPALRQAQDCPGFVGLKIHPSLHGRPGGDSSYEPAWRFAADHDLPIMTHSWSVSSYNPKQRLSTPERFEGFVKAFPSVRLVLGHAGGRGTGRHEAVRMANEYPNVYLDISGDIFDYRLIETLVETVPVEKILFGSDFPWLDLRSRLSHVLLADISAPDKTRILCENARRVYNRMATHPSQLSARKETASS